MTFMIKRLTESLNAIQHYGAVYVPSQMDDRFGDTIQIPNSVVANHLITDGIIVHEWIPVSERLPKKNGKYLIFTTQYFTPDHVDDIDHRDGIEISGYYAGHGFLSTNGMHAKYWTYLPKHPKEADTNG